MLLTNSYELWYNGASQHDIRAIGKAEIIANMTNSDNKKVADWALERLGAFDKAQSKIDGYKSNLGIVASNVAGQHIEHIHRNCAEDIKRNMEQYPVIDDAEASQILFEDEIQRELDKMAACETFTLCAG